MNTIIFPIIVSFFSLLFAFFLMTRIQRASQGSEKMKEISLAIKEGALAFLKRQYRTVAVVALVLFLLLSIFYDLKTGIGFLVGAVASGLAGFIGMMVAAKTNIRTAQASLKGIKSAFLLSFQGGAVTGFLVVGLGLLSVSLFYAFTHDIKALIALAFGGSLVSVFARLGGGIFTKAADIGADLVGKIEKGIPEDDSRNPAVIADNVGDNVGDCAGMAADLFETYVVTIVAVMILGGLLFPNIPEIILLPLILSAIAILCSIIAAFFVRLNKEQNILRSLYKGLIVSAVLTAFGFWPVIKDISIFLNTAFYKIYISALIGLVIAFGVFVITEYYTSKKHKPVRAIGESSKTGHAIKIISGLALGMKATAPFIILISIGILASFSLAGLYGLAITGLAMLSLAGIIIALDSYGPIADNAGGIAEMAGLPEKAREVTESLDAVGNTTKAVTKTYAIVSAGIAALVLFNIFTQELTGLGSEIRFLINDPLVLTGLFIGGLLPFYFAALSIESVGRTASKVIEEARRQFKEIKGIMEREKPPEYGKCVDIITKAALKEMIFPALLPVIVPIIIGFSLGPKALGGLLIGSIVTGLFIALSMSISGGAWDNAKKDKKDSLAYQSAVTGDIVGDPYKDTAGPAINPMIKVLNIVAILLIVFL